ncbi:hypothetical protein [Polaribacter atrinae]|uniref:Uncharacterized protein n=1 Tax=Polaribacter atrinae TaxID=1333662 RepID=A0A176TG13_9FLAO|nr:hypothetical protein [Polaribacter atrinae]OAD46709.1 hypothetical protein LPB303_00185 [Polaribacter atrinae]
MIKKVLIGIGSGLLIGVFVTSIFIADEINIIDLILTKITATSIITGFFTGIYAHLSKSKLKVFLVAIFIGIIIFYLKYLFTGHNFDPLTMGAFVGAILGGIFAFIRKATHSINRYNRLQRHKQKGFKK